MPTHRLTRCRLDHADARAFRVCFSDCGSESLLRSDELCGPALDGDEIPFHPSMMTAFLSAINVSFGWRG
jgi:hypothetical protein